LGLRIVSHPHFGQEGGSTTPLVGLGWPNHSHGGGLVIPMAIREKIKNKIKLYEGFDHWGWFGHP
jgi:hypothetical protein